MSASEEETKSAFNGADSSSAHPGAVAPAADTPVGGPPLRAVAETAENDEDSDKDATAEPAADEPARVPLPTSPSAVSLHSANSGVSLNKSGTSASGKSLMRGGTQGVSTAGLSTTSSALSEEDEVDTKCRCWRNGGNRVKTYLFVGTVLFTWLFVNGTLAEQGRVGVKTGNMTAADAGIAASRENWEWRVIMANIEFAMSSPIMWSIVYLIHQHWMPFKWFVIVAVSTCGLQMFVHSMALRYGPVTVYDQQYWEPIRHTDTLDLEQYGFWVSLDFMCVYSIRQYAPCLALWFFMRKSPEGRARNKRAGRPRCDEVFWIFYVLLIPIFAVMSQFSNNETTAFSIWIMLLVTPGLRFFYVRNRSNHPPPSLPYLMLCLNFVESIPHGIANFFRLQNAESAIWWLAAYELLATIIYHGWRYAALMASGDDEKQADLVLFQFRTFHLMLSEVIFLSVDPLGLSFFLLVLIEDTYLFLTFSGLGKELWQFITTFKVGFVNMTERELRMLAVDADQNLFGEMLAIVVVVVGIVAERVTVANSNGEFRPLLSKAAATDGDLGLMLIAYLIVAFSQVTASVAVHWVLSARDLKLQRDNTEEAAKIATELKLVEPSASSSSNKINASSKSLASMRSPSMRLQAAPSRRVLPSSKQDSASTDIESGDGKPKLARYNSVFTRMSRSKRELVTKNMVVTSSRATTKAIMELWVKYPVLVTSVTLFTAMKSLRLVMMISAIEGRTMFDRQA